MICPNSKKHTCNVPRSCSEFGCTWLAVHGKKGKPTMAEIERLVDALGTCKRWERDSISAALLTAIRDYGEGEQ